MYRSYVRFFAVFALIAVAEMATFFWVESRIGLGPALLLALFTAILGSFLVKRAGLSVLGRIQERTNSGELPGRELADGAAVLVSGAFLISPGFITDILGFLLLVTPVRDVLYKVISKRISGRFTILGTDEQPAVGDVIDTEGWE